MSLHCGAIRIIPAAANRRDLFADRRTGLRSAESEVHVQGLKIDCSATRTKLVDFLKDGLAKAGFERAVVGLSGGIDSALSAHLTVEALGRERVMTLFMPYKDSDPESGRHARLVADRLGTTFLTIDISAQVDTYFTRYPDADQIRRGNKMARERMSILFDHSAAWNGLVVGTSNRTEILLGYGTLFGDTACSINPLAGLFKTQVFALAREMGVPDEIVGKPPTADLWKGQTDEDELGFTYSDADKVLHLLIDRELEGRAIEAEGFDAALIDRIAGMVARFAFKSRPPLMAGPPVAAE